MGFSVRNSARQVGHQVAKYIIKTGRPAAARSAEVSPLPSTRCMAKAGGISPTLVPCGADGGGAGVAVGAGVSVGGGAVAAADGIAVGDAAAAVAAAVGGCGVLAAAAGGVAGCGVSVSVGDGIAVAAADAGGVVTGSAVVGAIAGGTGVSGGTAAAAVTMDAGSDATTVAAVDAMVAVASAIVAAGGGVSDCWQPASSAPAAMPTANILMIGLGLGIILRSVHDAGGYPHQLGSCRSCWRWSLCCWASDGVGAALGFADSRSR